MDKPNPQNLPVKITPGINISSTDSAEHQLWKHFLAGDASACQTLMTDYFRTLFRYGSRFSKDNEFIKDCIQDLFLYLWEHRASLRADVAIKPYLLVSLRRLMHRSLPNTTYSDEFTADKVNPFDFTFSVEEQYIQQETTGNQIRQMKQLLDLLPPRQKEVLYLKYFQELEREEIAEIMGIVPQTVSNLIQLAIKQLRQCVTICLMLFLSLPYWLR